LQLPALEVVVTRSFSLDEVQQRVPRQQERQWSCLPARGGGRQRSTACPSWAEGDGLETHWNESTGCSGVGVLGSLPPPKRNPLLFVKKLST